MLKIDLHIHTVASRHAHNTILEYVNQAKKLKMKIIGISDHGPTNYTTLTDQIYFRELKRMPDVINGIRVLKGVEVNIVDKNGEIDIEDKTIARLDYVMAGMHRGSPYVDIGSRKNTEAYIKTIHSGKVRILTHPFYTVDFPHDIAEMTDAACRHGVLPEANLSFLGRRLTPVLLDNIKTMVAVVKKNRKKLIVNSDAHNIWELGDDTMLKKYKKQIGLTDDLVINNYPKELFELLKLEKRKGGRQKKGRPPGARSAIIRVEV